MPAVLLALYDGHAAAERARTELVSDGFPTDRVELTSVREPGNAGMIPAAARSERFREYFCTLFQGENGQRRAEVFAERVCGGGATVTVHPRGDQEIARAKEILTRQGPEALAEENLDDTTMEHAASETDRPLIEQVVRGRA
ncbi:MAG TPA: hypothetical protein VNU73_09130 [Steroidobacteraceae bacterium]|jgi:hypothetical protein|nr:hypothetical protein [Steroidobacteraceae bacterium]